MPPQSTVSGIWFVGARKSGALSDFYNFWERVGRKKFFFSKIYCQIDCEVTLDFFSLYPNFIDIPWSKILTGLSTFYQVFCSPNTVKNDVNHGNRSCPLSSHHMIWQVVFSCTCIIYHTSLKCSQVCEYQNKSSSNLFETFPKNWRKKKKDGKSVIIWWLRVQPNKSRNSIPHRCIWIVSIRLCAFPEIENEFLHHRMTEMK